MKMLTLARAALPHNPFLLTLLSRTTINTGDQAEAAAIAAELRSLQWSELYYPEQAEAAEALAKLLEGS